jgi:hypothetical protein
VAIRRRSASSDGGSGSGKRKRSTDDGWRLAAVAAAPVAAELSCMHAAPAPGAQQFQSRVPCQDLPVAAASCLQDVGPLSKHTWFRNYRHDAAHCVTVLGAAHCSCFCELPALEPLDETVTCTTATCCKSQAHAVSFRRSS